MSFGAGQVTATAGRTAVSGKNGRVELVQGGDGGYRLAGLATDAVEAELTLPLGKSGNSLLCQRWPSSCI